MAIAFDSNYYRRVLQENGYESLRDELQPINFSLGSMGPAELSLNWLCHNGGSQFAENARITRNRVKVITGIGLSGTPHLGTLSQMLKAIRLQRDTRLSVKFVLGDLDAYNGKSTSLKYARKLADRVRGFMLDLGFDDTGSNEINGQYEELEIIRTMYLAGLFMDDGDFNEAEEDLHSFYVNKGKVDNSMSFRRKLSLALMVAGWLYQLSDVGDKHLLIMLGIDEHKYVKFGQKVLGKMQAVGEFTTQFEGSSIAAMYSTLIRGFNGYPKMSKSFPDSGIHLDMERDHIHRLVMHGEGDYEMPEENVVLQCISSASMYSSEEIMERHKLCAAGGSAWQDAKCDYVNHLNAIIEKWRKHLHQ